MWEVVKFVGYAAVGGVLVFCAMRHGQRRFDAGYRAGLAEKRVLPESNAPRRRG